MEREARYQIQRPEFLRRKYPVLVVDPYAENIIGEGPRRGQARLSFYSAFIIHTAREIIEDGRAERVILFDDASFGPTFPSTGDLLYDYLTRARVDGRIIHPSRVKLFKGKNLARTPTQVQKVAEYLKEQGLEGQEVLYLGWEYHMKRVVNHAQGFGVKIRYAIAKYAHKFYEPNFSYGKFLEVLPLDEIEKMEGGGRFSRRAISSWDKKGVIPAIFQSLPVLGGPRMLDNRWENGRLRFDYRKGKDRRKELGLA